MPEAVAQWSLTSLQEKLVNIAAKAVHQAIGCRDTRRDLVAMKGWPGRALSARRPRRAGVGTMRGACMSWFLASIPVSMAYAFELGPPIDCEVGRTCFIQSYVDHDPSPGASDYQCGTLSYDGHNGTDFRLPTRAAQRTGVNVLAAAEGQVLRARDGMADVSISAPGAPSVADRECGNGLVISHVEGWETQYCHLARGSLRVKAGDRVVAGQPLGQVGLSGKTEFPHLHLTARRHGKVIDPFAVGAPEKACGAGTSLWSPSVRASFAYRARAVLNAGFAAGPVTMEQIESGEADRIPPGAEAEALVAFVRTIGLKLGDVQRLSITGPGGRVIADHAERPLDRDKAQVMLFAGRKRPPAGWDSGNYRASYRVVRDGTILLEQAFEVSL